MKKILDYISANLIFFHTFIFFFSISLTVLFAIGETSALFYACIMLSMWALSFALALFGIWEYKKLETYFIEETQLYYNKLCQAGHALSQVYGHRGDLDDKVSIYSKMLRNNVAIPTANAVADFSHDLRDTDSILLIKVDNDNNTWHFSAAGRPIRLEAVEWVLTKVSERCKDRATDSSLIWLPKKIYN